MNSNPRIDFSGFFVKLNVNERVETLVREVIIGQSELHTLTNSYKIVIRSHGEQLMKLVSNKEVDNENGVARKIEELHALNEKINNSNDVCEVNETFLEFQSLFDSLKSDDQEEKELEKNAALVKKKNERFLNTVQNRLDEYCQRIMVMAEAQRNRKQNFDDNIDKEKLKMKEEMMSDVVNEFQKMRVGKLRTFVDGIEEIHFKHYNARLEAYKDVIEKHKVLSTHVFQLENQLRATKFEKRKIPYVHDRELEELTKAVASQDILIEELEGKLKAAQITRVNSVVYARREKTQINVHLSKILSETARKHAKLCKLSHQAIRKNLKLPERIYKKICKTPEDCACMTLYLLEEK